MQRRLARSPPSCVRTRINSRSNSANPPRTVSKRRPCAVVVSAHASPSERKPVLAFAIVSSVFKVPRRARRAVKPRHHEHVALGELPDNSAQLGAVGLRAGGPQRLHLGVNALTVR